MQRRRWRQRSTSWRYPCVSSFMVLSQWTECALLVPTKQRPRAEARGPFRQVFRTTLPTLADLPDMSVEVLADDAALTAIGIAVVIGVAAIAGAVIASVIVAAPTRANADANANRARAYPNALRVRRHRHRNTRRCEKSDGKFLHKNVLVAALMKTLQNLLVAALMKTLRKRPRFLKSLNRLFRDCDSTAVKQKIVPRLRHQLLCHHRTLVFADRSVTALRDT